MFFAAFCQVMFVTMNVYFISSSKVIPMMMTSFIVSLLWTYNVKIVSIGSLADRAYYAAGASAGTGLGFFISHNIINKI